MTRRYSIESKGNGAFVTVTRLRDGASVFFQGDDAVTFTAELDATHERWTDDDVCAEYDEVMLLPRGAPTFGPPAPLPPPALPPGAFDPMGAELAYARSRRIDVV